MRFLRPNDFTGRVGEWLKPADCKSAAPCGLRRFESFPVHQALDVGLAENRRAIASAMFDGGLIRSVDRFAVATGKTTPLRNSAPRRIEFGGKRVEPG